jgi:alkanesulfonate monooxygenase SsuD/methylene tetrahydromethanopterin reductase-like flavin-dependent oxidoreductase (luciferase family)
VKLGLTLPSFVRDPEIPLGVARASEDAELDAVFVYDHLFRVGADGTRRPALEAVALLGAVAQATSTISVGSLVFRAGLRPPASLGAAIRTAVRIAPGRVLATIGAGDSQSREENVSFGLGFGTMADRIAMLRATVVASREKGATVWVGGLAEPVQQVAAECADGWNAWGIGVDEFAAKAARVRALEVPDDFECTWGGLVVVGEDDDRAAEKARRLHAPPETIVGGPASVARALDRFGAAGADWVIAAPVDSQAAENAHLLGEVRQLVTR